MNFKTQTAKQLYTLKGSFAYPTDEIKVNENELYYLGDGYEITTVLRKHTSGVCIRKDVIKNVSDKNVTFRAALSKFTFCGGEYEVYTQYSEWCRESVGKWNTLISEISIGNADIRANAGNSPFLAIYNTQNGRGMAFHLLAESTWQIKAKKDYSQNGQTKAITVEAGISEKGFNYELTPGETIEMPTILYYEFKNKTDMDAYKLHRYYNDVKPASKMPLIYDTWLSNFDDISYELLTRQLEQASELSFEYFVIDAGWFDKPYIWFNNVGDWKEETETSMKGRMKEFADAVRSKGLKFGLWFEIERAGLTSKAFKEHPEYYLVENGNAFVNFANKEASDYVYKKLAYNIDKYGIEFIKFDFNAELTYDSLNHSFIDYFKGYNEFLRRIKSEHPEIYLENCASGGMRMSLAGIDYFDSYWMSDNHSLYAQLEIFKNTVIRMPSRMLEKWLTIASFENFTPTEDGMPAEKILVSGNQNWSYVETISSKYLKNVMFGGPIGASCNLEKLSNSLKTLLKEKFNEFKNDREFWMNSE